MNIILGLLHIFVGGEETKAVTDNTNREMVKMSYDFTFDLSRLSQPLFKEIAEFSEKERVHEKIGDMARNIVQKFHVDKITGLPICDSLTVIEDLINIQITNSLLKEHFYHANKRALFLPHCCRKYMDSRCKAEFDSIISPLMSQCNGENRIVENLENWYPIKELPFLDSIEKNNYLKIIFNDFIIDYPDFKQDIIKHDNIIREFNHIYNKLIDCIVTDKFKSIIEKMIKEFNKNEKTVLNYLFKIYEEMGGQFLENILK